MTHYLLALKSLLFHRRVNVAIALGVMAATAVLTGALIVGDSMRGSLRDLTLDRLGKVDVMIFSQGFFREELATELQDTDTFQAYCGSATTMMFFPNGTAERSQDNLNKTLGQVNLLGIHKSFWHFGDDPLSGIPELDDDEVIINSVVAEDLGLTQRQIDDPTIPVQITVGIPKQSLLPSDSALGNKSDLVERIVDLKVVKIIPATSLGRFGLYPTQIPPRNVYLSIHAMQDALTDGILKYKDSREQANVILVSSKDPRRLVDAKQAKELQASLHPELGDLGLRLKRVTRNFDGDTVFDYFSLSSDRLVFPDDTALLVQTAFPNANSVFTYLANDIIASSILKDAPNGDEVPRGIPFSMITSLDLNRYRLESVSGGFVSTLSGDEIAVTRWAADDQGLEIGDRVLVAYFEPETTHGQENELTHEFVVADIVELIEPSEPPRSSRRDGDVPAVFSERPARANDPDLTPGVPGLTDAESIERWDLPFETADKIRPQDDDYWTYYRTTPKAYVSLDTARKLWGSRFGRTTSFQIPADRNTESRIRDRLLGQFKDNDHLPGIQVVPVKARGLKASSGSTPFDALFLSLSMFVIGSALALVSLLFRLALQKRSNELGTLLATGFSQKQVGRIWVLEMLGVCLAGSLAGLLTGVGYAALMVHGLKTWWIGAITTPFLNMHINGWTLPAGLLLGTSICVATIYWSVRSARKKSVRELLAGQIEPSFSQHSRFSRFANIAIAACGILAIALTVLAATSLAGESQAGAFMTSGFLILVAALVAIYKRLETTGNAATDAISLVRLSMTNAARNPLRSTLTVGLVAVASFLILAISAFRLSPTSEGTAGFNYLATTSQPIFVNLNHTDGQREVLIGDNDILDVNSRVLSFRHKSGEDASCNNPYQSSQPQVLGVTEETMAYFDNETVDQFSFSMTSGANPWRLLDDQTDDGVIPVIIDKNTAWYSLKVYLPGSEFTVNYDSGEKIRFRLVGLLSNSVLQGTLLISEANFTRVFPQLSGYRTFLMKLKNESEINRLSSALSDQGFDARSTERLLSGFLAVQNTYLSTFQSLGLLGLLLGTFGLAAVQLRSVMERRKELGLMRAVGFTKRQLARMILVENAWLLLAGMATGIFAALVTTLPHYFFGSASIPWLALSSMFAFIAIVGLLTSWLASRSVFNAPLIESLRVG